MSVFPTLEYVERLEAEARKLTEGVRLIARERSRQIDKEGWSPDHDAGHSTGELAMAAAAYATPAERRKYALGDESPGIWPWDNADWKPTPSDRVRELTKAGALIAAEIDRLLRETEHKGKSAPNAPDSDAAHKAGK